jgi:hypothetical protein
MKLIYFLGKDSFLSSGHKFSFDLAFSWFGGFAKALWARMLSLLIRQKLSYYWHLASKL